MKLVFITIAESRISNLKKKEQFLGANWLRSPHI